jgi:N6-L-threonylcarbamoyladenine synthase
MTEAALTLGIETSCDETAVAVLSGETEILSSLVYSQAKLHARYGGVVPEVASRDHVRKLPYLVREALDQAKVPLSSVSLVAATRGPGLVGPLLVGLSHGKGIAFGLGVPFIGVNHLEGHLFAHRLSAPEAPPPFMGLVVSGGHTSLVLVREYGSYQLVGSTMDDAAGEALDKVGKLLGIGYPGGAEIDRLARIGDPKAIPFPRPMGQETGFDFSFAGLKTAVLYHLKAHPGSRAEDVAASFMASVVDVLVTKSIEATRRHHLKRLVVVGGVAASTTLRARLAEKAAERGIAFFTPPLDLCTDNAAMIAAAGAFRHATKGESDPLSLSPAPSLSF